MYQKRKNTYQKVAPVTCSLLFIFFTLFIRCMRDEEVRFLKENITKLYGSEIIFTDTLLLLDDNKFRHAKASSLLGNSFTIVKRIEADCPKCINDLRAFSEEISVRLDTSIVKPVYIIHTNNYNQFKDLVLPGITGIHPLVIDTMNKFLIDNDLPMFDQRFHTLLIDSWQRIVLIGDPSDERMETLYMKYIDF